MTWYFIRLHVQTKCLRTYLFQVSMNTEALVLSSTLDKQHPRHATSIHLRLPIAPQHLGARTYRKRLASRTLRSASAGGLVGRRVELEPTGEPVRAPLLRRRGGLGTGSGGFEI